MYTFSQYLEEAYSEEQKEIANKTSRAAGSVSGKAIVPRFVLSTIEPTKSILDYGAGHAAIHTQKLRSEGFSKITAYDFGSNLDSELHDNKALKRKYDVVYASNVLNVQSSIEMLEETLDEIKSVMKISSVFISNLPAAPRKFQELNSDLLVKELRKRFKVVEFYRIDKDNKVSEVKTFNNPGTIFKCAGLK
jgi:hypothetical protein